MLTFAERKRLATQFENWCKSYELRPCALSMTVYLHDLGMFNEGKVREYLKDIPLSKNVEDGMQKFKEENE